MSYKISESIIISNQELQEDKDFMNYFFRDVISSPWIIGRTDLIFHLTFHKTSLGFLVDIHNSKFGQNILNQQIFKIKKGYLIEKYFNEN